MKEVFDLRFDAETLEFTGVERNDLSSRQHVLAGAIPALAKGDESELGFEGLAEIYRDVEVVNRAMANRLRSICEKDGTVGAVVLLDTYAKILPAAIEDALEELEPLYEAYLNPAVRSAPINLRSGDCGHIRILSDPLRNRTIPLSTNKGSLR